MSLIALVIGVQLMNESNATTYLQTYLVKNNHLDPTTAAYCLGLLSTFTTIGRVINIFLTLKIGIQTFLFINFGLMILSTTLIMTVGVYSLYGIYAGLVFLGFGFSNRQVFLMGVIYYP